MTSMTTKLLFSIAAAAGAACLAAGCTNAQGVEAKAPRPVKAIEATVAPAPAGIRYSATIEAFQQVPLAFKTSGYVDDVVQRQGADGRMRAAQAGDRIGKGTVLARVHQSDYQERVNQGRAKLAEGDASLTKAALDLERAKKLFAADSLIKPDLDSAQAAYDSASARVTAAKADIELALSALRDCSLIAPSAGVLLDRRIEVGTLVGAGSVAFVLGDVSSVKARFGIPDAMIQSVKLGEPIAVTVDALSGTAFTGKVTALAPAADPQSRVFDVEVTIPNADSRLRPGMIGSVALGAAVTATAQPLTIPLTAVVKFATSATGGGYGVMVVEGHGDVQIARLRSVELGDVMGNGIAVLKGVNHGDRVIVTGASLLVDGDSVRVIPGSGE
jgi:RND family efflux transporter MFP subunit